MKVVPYQELKMRPNSPTNHRGFSAIKMNRLGANKQKSEALKAAVKKMKVKPKKSIAFAFFEVQQ
jgi:hypothetical protein